MTCLPAAPWLKSAVLFGSALLSSFSARAHAAVPGSPSSNLGLAEVQRMLMTGRADQAIAGARTLAAGGNAQAKLLLCRAEYSVELAAQAVADCEAAAVALNTSEAQDWLGRAYGMQADKSGPLTGLKLAHRVRDAFEAAVRLNPHDPDAFDDLAEFYLEAPALVGGGLDRARALADRGTATTPERARRLKAMIAENTKDYATAEREFRDIAQTTGRADAWLDLGLFYKRRKQWDQSVAAVRQSVALNNRRNAALVAAAQTLLKMNRELPTARQAIESYLAGPTLSDAAPAFQAHKVLGDVLAASGNRAAAKIEYGKALELASNYAPAQKALKELQ